MADVIKFEKRDLVLTQEYLQKGADLQAFEWLAIRRTRKFMEKTEALVARGATVEPGELEFDGELHMVRRVTKKKTDRMPEKKGPASERAKPRKARKETGS